jgi:hypothetical protein
MTFEKAPRIAPRGLFLRHRAKIDTPVHSENSLHGCAAGLIEDFIAAALVHMADSGDVITEADD